MYDLGMRDGLSAYPLFTVRPKVLVAADFVGPESHTITLASLADEPMILIDIPPGESFYRSILASVRVTPRVVHQTSSVEGVRALVARGLGWSMLLQQSRTNLSYEGRPFRELDITDDVPDVALLAVTLRGRLTRRTSAFRDYCVNGFAAGGSDKRLSD
jgi:DNA-binding transcriptional LysR family regulator